MDDSGFFTGLRFGVCPSGFFRLGVKAIFSGFSGYVCAHVYSNFLIAPNFFTKKLVISKTYRN